MISSSGRAGSVQRFREPMSQGMVVGTFSKSLDSAYIEVMCHTGSDFVVLDLEHGPNNALSLQNLIGAAEVTGLSPIVRVKQDTRHSSRRRLTWPPEGSRPRGTYGNSSRCPG